MSNFATATPTKHVAAVNGKLAGACIFGGLAYFMWPDSAYWWPFYFYSALCGAGALAFVVQALSLIRKIRTYERDQREFEAQGKPIKAASLGEEDVMTRDGVIRHVK